MMALTNFFLRCQRVQSFTQGIHVSMSTFPTELNTKEMTSRSQQNRSKPDMMLQESGPLLTFTLSQ